QSARTALGQKKYDEALRHAMDASKLYPGDKAAQDLVKEIQTLKANADTDAAKRTAYTQHITAAQKAMTAKQYDDAIKSANDALKLFPGDAAATALLKDANTAKAGVDAEKKKSADYTAAVQAARASLAQKKYDDALRHATDATKLFPGDKAAQDLV